MAQKSLTSFSLTVQDMETCLQRYLPEYAFPADIPFKMHQYLHLLYNKNQNINLVAASQWQDPQWFLSRHVGDALQLLPLIREQIRGHTSPPFPPLDLVGRDAETLSSSSAVVVPSTHSNPSPCVYMDLGSGAGLPGVFLSLLLSTMVPSMPCVLIESIGKKASFLQDVANHLDSPYIVLRGRIEDLLTLWPTSLAACYPERSTKKKVHYYITARAVAPVSKILAWVPQVIRDQATFILPKGAQVDREVEVAQKAYPCLHYDLFPSQTDPHAHILRIQPTSF